MSQSSLQVLLGKYLLEELSEQEMEELWATLKDPSRETDWNQWIGEVWNNENIRNLADAETKARVQTRLNALLQEVSIPRQRTIGRRVWWAAAAVVITGGLVAYFAWDRITPADNRTLVAGTDMRFKNDVNPGADRAILKLADGSTIVLDSAASGVLYQQNNVRVVMLDNGELSYEVINAGTGEVSFNTMSTPRGGQFKLRLPDGSNVWLNAASSITYPVVFTGKERRVSITGEAYFEVSKDPARRFYVDTKGATVSVLGTHFDINAYEEDSHVKTTLLEGSVEISNGDQSDILKPGEQALLKSEGKIVVLADVDTEEVIAWKNGYFQFADADMEEVMNQIERWYDVDVSYEGRIPERSFSGGIQRTLPLSRVLKILEENEVKFEIDGRNIKVLK